MSQTKQSNPRTFKTNPQTAGLLVSINPLVSKVTKRLQEDAENKISSSTALFFGFLFVVGIFVISILLYNTKSILTSDLSDALETTNGRGTNMPNVVPAANSPEGQEYMESHRPAPEPTPEAEPRTAPTGVSQVKKQEFYDEYGEKVDSSSIDFNQYTIKEAI